MFHEDSAAQDQFAGPANPTFDPREELHPDAPPLRSTRETREAETRNDQPSVADHDRYGLANKSFLTRKYNVRHAQSSGLPYFEPIESLVLELVRNAPEAITEARYRVSADEALQEQAEILKDSFAEAFKAVDDQYESDWVARRAVTWPLTEMFGSALYRALQAQLDLENYGAYLVNTKQVNDASELPGHKQFADRAKWLETFLEDAGKWDFVIQGVEETEYNLNAIIRQGFRQAAQMDTKSHLRGPNGSSPASPDAAANDANIKAQIRGLSKLAS